MKDFCKYCCSDIDDYAHEDELHYLSDVCDDYEPNNGIPIRLKTSQSFECSSFEGGDTHAQIGLEIDATLRMDLVLWGEELHITIDEGICGADVFEPSTDEYIKIAKLKINYCPMCGRKLKKED